MAKRTTSPKDDSGDIKKLLDGLYKIIHTTNATSKEQVRINRELLKTMAVLQSGFAQNETDARRLIEDVRDGLELNDEYAKKWLKKAGATEKQIEDIVDKFRDLEKLDVDLIDNAEDYLDLLEKRFDVLDDTFDLTKRLLTNHDAITRAIRASKDVAGKLAGPMGDVNSILEKMVAKKVDVSSMFDGMSGGVEMVGEVIDKIRDDISGLINNVGGSMIDLQLNFSPLTDDLDNEIKSVLQSIDIEKSARISGLMEYFDLNKKLQNQLSRSLASDMSGIDVKFDVDTGQISTATGILQKGTDEYEAMIQKLDEIADKNNITDKLKVDFKEIADLISVGGMRTDEQSDRLKQLLIPMDLATKMMIKQIDLKGQDAQESVIELARAKERYKLMGSYLNQLQTAESIVLKIGSGFDHLNGIMPTGIGEFLGLSKVSSSLIESHKKGVQAFADELEKGVSHADALRSYYKELTPALSSALSPMTVLITSTVLLFNFVSNIVDKYKELSGQLKTSLGQSKKLYETQLDILTSQKNQFATLEDITAAQSAMIGTSGKVFDLTDSAAKELTISLIETGKAFGYGTEKAVELHKIFNRLGADDRLAESLQQNLGLLSEAAGISPQIITDDLIDSAEEVSIYFAGMPQQAAKAAIQVRQMGMSLKQAGHIAQKMLNFEGFMTDMYELQAMTAGGIDFSKAFDKGLMGDIQGMTEEIMNNIGSVADFDRMDYLTRLKIANTLDMSVDDLAKSVKLRQDMTGMSEKEQKYLRANIDKMGDISSASKEEIRNRMQQLQATDRLNVAWDKIKGTLVKALLPAVEIIADAIDAISPILDGIVFTMKIFGGLLKIVFPIIKGMLFPFKLIGSALDKITSAIDSASSGLSGFGPILDGIGTVLQVIGGIFGSIFVIRNIGTFFSFIVSGFGTIIKLVGSFGSMMTGSLAGVFESLTGVSLKSAAATANATQTVTDSTNQSIKSTKDTAKAAINELSGVTNAATTSVQDAMKASETTIQSTVASTTKAIDPIKSSSTAAVTEISGTTTTAIAQVEKAAKQASVSVDQVQAKTKKGFFSTDRSKSVFKAIGAIGATTFATLATNAAMSFFKAGKDGEESMTNMASTSIPMIGSAFAMLGPMLFDSLSQGVERFVRKRLEGKLETAFEGPLKKIRKGFGSLEVPATRSLEKVGERGKGIFSRMFDQVKKVAPKPFGAVTGALSKITSKFGKGSGLFGKIFGSIPKMPIQEVQQSVESIGGSIDQVQQIIPEVQDVASKPIDQKVIPEFEKAKPVEQTIKTTEVVEQTVKPMKGVEPKIPEKIDAPKMDSIDTKSVESKGQKVQRSITKTFQSISDAIESVWNKIKSSISSVIDFGIDILKKIATGIVDVVKILVRGIQDISNQLFSILKSLSKTLKGILGDVIDFAVKSGKQIASGIVDVSKTLMKGIESITDSLFSILENASSTLKSILNDIVDFAAKSMKQLSSGIGQSIKNVLKGIGDGLSSFKTSALTGAAALVVLSGALWISSKAIQNFAETKWEDVAKSGIVLGGLVVAALALGSASPAMILGSIAIAALGAALIPVVYAMNKFQGIDWSSLGKAGTALIGFGVVASGFALAAPLILAGAATLVAASGALIIFSGSMSMLSNSITTLDVSPITSLTSSLIDLTGISVSSLFDISAALVAVGSSLVAFSAMRFGSSIITSISGLFANDLLKDLDNLASLANPLQIAANAIQTLGASLSELSMVMNTVDLGKIDDLAKVGKISVEQKMYDQIQGQLRDVEAMPRESTPEIKVVPVQLPAPKVQTPRKQAVAQDVKIVDNKQMPVESGVRKIAATPMISQQSQGQKQNNTDTVDIYNRPELQTKEIKFLLQEAVKLLEVIAKKNLSLNIDSYKVNKLIKPGNNQ